MNSVHSIHSRQMSAMVALLLRKEPVSEVSEDYPHGGSVEPYDIAMENELTAE